MTVRSRPTRPSNVAYTEVDGHAVLCHLDEALVHVLDDVGVALWAALDGRSVQEIADASDDPGPSRVVLVEAVRRLRALDLVEEATAGAPGDPPAPLELAGRSAGSLVLRGEVRATERQPTLRVGPGSPSTVVVEMEPRPHIEGGGDIRSVEAMPTADHGRGPTPSRLAPLPPIDAMRVLVAAALPATLHAPGAVDALAELAERIPVSGEPTDAAPVGPAQP